MTTPTSLPKLPTKEQEIAHYRGWQGKLSAGPGGTGGRYGLPIPSPLRIPRPIFAIFCV
jgi:hypothetical protein